MGRPILSESGSTVTMDTFIAVLCDNRFTAIARFWDMSGLTVNVATDDLAVKVDSLAALIEDGTNFGTPVTGGDRIVDGHLYETFPTEAAARANAHLSPEGVVETLWSMLVEPLQQPR